MLLVTRRIWSAQAADVTTTFNSVSSELDNALSFILTLETTGFSGLLDVQGREGIGDTWANVRYQLIEDDYLVPFHVGAPTDVQLKFQRDSSRKRYLVPIAPTYMRLVLERGAGSISAWARGSGTFIRAFEEPAPDGTQAIAEAQLRVLEDIRHYLKQTDTLSAALLDDL